MKLTQASQAITWLNPIRKFCAGMSHILKLSFHPKFLAQSCLARLQSYSETENVTASVPISDDMINFTRKYSLKQKNCVINFDFFVHEHFVSRHALASHTHTHTYSPLTHM